MKIRILFITALTLLLSGCSGQNGKDKEQREAEYSAQLEQQIKAASEGIDSCNAAIIEMRRVEDERLAEFTTVDNAREAAPYIVYTPCKELYPPAKTALVARMADNGQFELIAALTGKKFNQIRVSSGELSATSDIVPPDQALNYFADNLNTVMFTGTFADSIGMLINGNDMLSFRVEFLQGAPVYSTEISQREMLMISRTYNLYHARKEINMLERRIPLLNRKINILRQHLEKIPSNP